MKIFRITTKHAQLTDVSTPHIDSDLAFGLYEKVTESDVTGSAVASVTINNLDGDSDNVYLIFVLFKNANASASEYLQIRLNGDTGKNYDFQVLEVSDTSVTGTQNTGETKASIGASALASGVSWCRLLLYAKSGVDRIWAGVGARKNVKIENIHGAWHNSADNLTSITFLTNSGSAYIDVGSKFFIYKVKL